ncbi:MAG TPA: hypothetical protein VEV15_01080, partial [Flavisolibacter sp.]|nr:hypothetical protein [Flavisolibacter sp.]
VVITAERPPVIVRKDTIEFNAESFKTLPTAMVEDLLKKLPGVSVGQDGEIQVNGKAVSKILVDGKEFFGGDQQLATKNLPANIIDKVQISADQEALRRDPDLTEANIPQVINLKLKKAIKQGAFGKLYAGGGLNNRYETGGILNIFRDTTQVSVLAYGNNLNKSGFSMGDISRIGGFGRSGFNSLSINSNGGFEINGITFGGMGSGVMTSSGAGANFNTLTKSGIKLNTQYFFGQTNSDLNQQTNNNQSLGNYALISNSQLFDLSRNYTHRVSGKIDWKIDSLTNLVINPMVSITSLQSDRNEEKTSQNNAGELLNTSNNSQKQDQKKVDYNLSGNLYRDFRKKGRTATVSLELSKTDNTNDNFNLALNQFYLNSSSSILDQYRNTQISSHSGSARMNFTEPFSKKLALKMAANTRYLNNENALYTFYRNPANQNYDIAVPQFSETVQQSGWKNNVSVKLDWKPIKDLTITPGIAYNTISLSSQFIKYANFKQNYSFVAPDINIRYKSYAFSYDPTFREPDMQYIQPVVNNTDPLFIQQG